MRKKEIIRLTGAYFGVILGSAIIEFVLKGRIEHVLNKLIVVAIGYIVLLVVYMLIALIRRKQLKVA